MLKKYRELLLNFQQERNCTNQKQHVKLDNLTLKKFPKEYRKCFDRIKTKPLCKTVAIRLTIFFTKNCQTDRRRCVCIRLYSTAANERGLISQQSFYLPCGKL
ncbi:MAG: hypothetical protein LBP59_10260 [Planctomycetaceae bacterium]|nr:hypothetical protein [Planctomycetaceae bacterium]